MHFHSYTMETVAKLSLYGAKQLAPGQNAFAEVRLASPALSCPEIASSCGNFHRWLRSVAGSC